MTPDLILAAMLQLPPSYLDRAETAEQRAELLRPVAHAIATTARNDSEAALLIADGFHESGYSRAVLEYRCQDISRVACDRNRARGFGQVHGWCRGTGPLAEARCLVRVARYGAEHCRDHALSPVAGSFAALAARPCTWGGSEKRVATYRRVLARLRAASGEEKR